MIPSDYAQDQTRQRYLISISALSIHCLTRCFCESVIDDPTFGKNSVYK